MIFKMGENTLKRRLKFYMPALFIVAGVVSVAIFSILLKTVYQLSSSIISYLYIFIFILIAVFCVSIYFDCLKLEKGKFIAIGKIYVIKAGLAVVLVAIFSYSLHIYLGKISIFEMLNIRLIMVVFLISVAMSIASTSFNILVGPLYKKTGKKEYHLPIAYNFLPISIATVIFIVTFVNGMHYRSEIVYDRQYDIITKKGYANDFANNIADSIGKYVTVANNVSAYMNIIYRNTYTLDTYTGLLSDYLSTRYANDNNISSVAIYFGDLENVNININTNEVNKLSISWKYDINDLANIETNARPNLSVNYTSRLSTETNTLIDITPNANTFYIYSPILLNKRHVGFVSVEVRSSVYLDVLSNDTFKTNLNIFLTDDLYNIKASNNPSLIGDTQRDFDSTAIGIEIKNNSYNNYRNNIVDVNVISFENTNLVAIKYYLFNNLYVINMWQHNSAYKNQLFRNTIIKSSISIYL
ncbi:methyl-accepting chemotaxis protein, partial [Brachyspira intermedia]